MMEIATDPSRKPEEEGELLLIDKPLGWTSFDVIHRLRCSFDIEKAGHAGTLDPMATGLLIVCTGKQTKSIEQFTNLDKEYTGSFQLGIRTPSFDMETAVSEHAEFSGIRLEDLRSAVKSFVGRQMQTPPMYSAVKLKGKPLYQYARKGKTLERKAREIDVREFTVLSFAPPNVEFRVVCSKGTYIRSLVDGVGTSLGCGATLTSLRRTRVGSFRVENALTIEQLEDSRDSKPVLLEDSHGHHIPA
jgi:tRNA pseudouridine55 synthase